MKKSRKKLSRNGILVLLGAALAVTIIGSVTLGRYPIGLRELGLILAGIMVSSLVSSGTSMIKLAADPEDQRACMSTICILPTETMRS